MIIIEVLNKMGKVSSRTRHQSFPIRIGRAYEDNDVILDDEYVSPCHLSIESNDGGTIKVVDAQSENGSYLLPSGQRISQLMITDEILLRVGHTTLRVRTPEFVLPPTTQDTHYVTNLIHSFDHLWIFTGILLLTTGYVCLETYWQTFYKAEMSELIVMPMWLMILVGVWAGGWALISKTWTQQHCFKIHASIVCLAILVSSLMETLTEYYTFAFSADLSGDILLWGSQGLILGMMLWAHFRLSSLRSSNQLALRAGILTTCFMGILGFSLYVAETEFLPALGFHGELKPPTFQISGSRSLDQFFNDVQSLKTRVDQLASEK